VEQVASLARTTEDGRSAIEAPNDHIVREEPDRDTVSHDVMALADRVERIAPMVDSVLLSVDGLGCRLGDLEVKHDAALGEARRAAEQASSLAEGARLAAERVDARMALLEAEREIVPREIELCGAGLDIIAKTADSRRVDADTLMASPGEKLQQPALRSPVDRVPILEDGPGEVVRVRPGIPGALAELTESPDPSIVESATGIVELAESESATPLWPPELTRIRPGSALASSLVESTD